MFNQFYDNPSDDRAIFANKVLKLIYQKYNGNFSSITFQNEVKDIKIYFDEYVRNIYEVIDTEIPLFAWANYLNYGFDKSMWDEGEMTEEEWKQIIFSACKKYYE
ncbi:hypothetical protein ACX818_001384 [Acinetobacter baumannii]